MSNLIKSGFVAFSQNDKLVIDANENKIIKAIDAEAEELRESEQNSLEEVLAEALIRDADIEGMEFDIENVSSTASETFSDFSQTKEETQQVVDEMIHSAQNEADEIISKAHEEAEQLRANAYEEAKQIRQDAQEEGYQAGYENATQILNKEFEEKEVVLEQRHIELENTFQEKEKQLIKETEHRMVDLLCQLIPSVTGVVVENQREVLLYMINSAMHDLDNSKRFVIKVSSSDYEDLVERKDEIYSALNPSVVLEIFEDAKLAPMQCLIETDNGIVDVSLDVQLDNIIKALKLMIVE